MTTQYFIALLSGAAVCAALFAWRLRTAGMKSGIALISLALSLPMGLISARIIYFLLEMRDMLVRYDGMGGLLSANPQEFSLIGGCLGVVLAVVLAGKLTGERPSVTLDAFAPCGALMVAFARASEGLLDPMKMIGMGEYVMDERWHFFPVAVENEMLYSWFYAIFMLEAALALICAVGGFALSRRRRFTPGRVFLHTMCFLALPQILCEQLLGQCMTWGFVRIEQLLCAVIVFGVILNACIRQKRTVACLPAIAYFVCVATFIWMEFTLDNKLLFGIDIPTVMCYAIMVAALVCIAGLEQYSYHRLNKT